MKDEGRTKEYYSLGERKVTEERVKKGLKIKNWEIGNRQQASGNKKMELGVRIWNYERGIR